MYQPDKLTGVANGKSGTIEVHAAECSDLHLPAKSNNVCGSTSESDAAAFATELYEVMSGLRDDGVVNFPWKTRVLPCVAKHNG